MRALKSNLATGHTSPNKAAKACAQVKKLPVGCSVLSNKRVIINRWLMKFSLGMSKVRLDQALVQRGLVASRSQAENYIRLGKVSVNKKIVTKAGAPVQDSDLVVLETPEQY